MQRLFWMRQQGTFPINVTALYLVTNQWHLLPQKYQNETEMKVTCQAKLPSRSTTWRRGLQYAGEAAQMLQMKEHFPSSPCASKQEPSMRPLRHKNVAVSPKHRDAGGFRYLKPPCDPTGITPAWSETSPVPQAAVAAPKVHKATNGKVFRKI